MTNRLAVIGLVISFIITSLLASWFLLQFLGIEELSYPTAYILILLFGILVTISTFFPYKWGKLVRIVAYIFLFISLLFVEVGILKHYVKRVDVNIESCQNIFFPQSSANNIVYDALSYVSCIFTGYVPQNQTIIGWSTFILFYIILPFAFIWAFIHVLMKEIMDSWFQQTPHLISILSFITAIYATRTFFGAFLLTFFGYGAWGLAGIFIAIFLVKGLENLIEKRFEIEKYSSELEKTLKSLRDVRADFAIQMLVLVENARHLLRFDRDGMLWGFGQTASIRGTPAWELLSENDRKFVNSIIEAIGIEAKNGDLRSYTQKVEELRNLLLIWRKEGER